MAFSCGADQHSSCLEQGYLRGTLSRRQLQGFVGVCRGNAGLPSMLRLSVTAFTNDVDQCTEPFISVSLRRRKRRHVSSRTLVLDSSLSNLKSLFSAKRTKS